MKRLPFLWFCLFVLNGISNGATYHAVKVSELDFGKKSAEVAEALKLQSLNTHEKTAINIRCRPVCAVGSEDNRERFRYLAQSSFEIVFRLDDDKPVEGFIDLRATRSDGNGTEVKAFPFLFKPAAETACTKERFEEIRSLQANLFVFSHVPGTAWFKHLGGSVEQTRDARNWRGDSLEDSFGIFSGGRAISENLALDRELILSADENGRTVALKEIEGITVPAIDWKSRLPEGKVAVDALSLVIPEDQHAVFAKSLPELLALIERAETQLAPAAQAYSVRSPFRSLASRYRAQMGLDVPAIAARLLPVKSVAITGGDPYFPQGSDVAFVMESDTPELLYNALLKTIQAKAAKVGAAARERDGDGYYHTSFQSADRTFSSHVWRMDGVVAVSNSTMQIQRLIDVAKNEKGALGATDEFCFFRNRYPLADEESAFVFLSDATIRRWAGPELRIAASRRTRAVAALGKLTSQALSGEDLSDDFEPLLGDAIWKDGRIISPVYGSLGFVTPASELGIDSATLPEKVAYERWRNGYENGWAQAFDPIAIRIRSKGDSIAFDLSVMPLTVDSDFTEFISLCGKAELSELARWVPAESLFHAAIALDTESETFRKYDKQIIEFLPGLDVKPLGWMTGSVSVDLGKSLFWDAGTESGFDHFARTPVTFRIGSNSRLKLALFMTALKTSVETSAPDSVRWETRKKDGKSYVVITGNEMGSDFHIFYATMPNALLVSLREDGLLRAMKRESHTLSRKEAAALPASTQLMLDSSPAFLSGLPGIFDSTGTVDRVQQESWKALPILNEWHRKFAGKDPLAVQLEHYGEDIFCPGGKGYRWNAEAMTMESVAFGFPAEPKTDPAKMPGIMNFPTVSTSLKFQDDGLRATLALGKTPERLPTPSVIVEGGKFLATAEELTPVKDGMTLTYKGISNGAEATTKHTTRNIVRDGGNVSFDVVTEGTEVGQEPYVFSSSYLLGKKLEMTSSSNGKDDNFEYSDPYLELPEKLVSGEITRESSKGISVWKDEEGVPVEEAYTAEHEIRVLGKEDVEVPAGKFSGCVVVEVVGEMLNGGRFLNEKFLAWYHPEVGIVKFEYLEGQDTRMELQGISGKE